MAHWDHYTWQCTHSVVRRITKSRCPWLNSERHRTFRQTHRQRGGDPQQNLWLKWVDPQNLNSKWNQLQTRLSFLPDGNRTAVSVRTVFSNHTAPCGLQLAVMDEGGLTIGQHVIHVGNYLNVLLQSWTWHVLMLFILRMVSWCPNLVLCFVHKHSWQF